MNRKKSYFGGKPLTVLVSVPDGLLPSEATSRSAFLLRKTDPVTPFCRSRLIETTELKVSITPSVCGCTWFSKFSSSERVRLLKVGSATDGGTLGM